LYACWWDEKIVELAEDPEIKMNLKQNKEKVENDWLTI